MTSVKKKVLIVDDSDFDRVLLKRALALKAEYEVYDTNDGNSCLELLNSQQVDLILLDIMMPDMDGNELLQKIREKFNAVELPVIMITGKTDAIDVINSLKLGANDYITKPVNFDVAIMRISNQFKISDLSSEMAKLQQVAALHAMVATYNHEINNPLAIAIASLNQLTHDKNNDNALDNAEKSLWRIADIVKKIKEVTEKSDLSYVEYSGGQNMLKVK